MSGFEVGIVTFFAMFALARIVSGKEGDGDRWNPLIFSWKNQKVHIHHWMYAGTILILLLISGWGAPYLYGGFFGIFLQGFTYNDWNHIIVSHSDSKHL